MSTFNAMIVVTYPFGLNWFYERLAKVLEDELNVLGIKTVAIPAHELTTFYSQNCDDLLVIAPAESAESAKKFGVKGPFIASIRKFSRRIILNYDSLDSHWFMKNFEIGDNLFTDIFDICAVAQTLGSCQGLPYYWIPEALWFRLPEAESCSWSTGRTFPWAVIGQESEHRVSLVSALIELGRPNGFVYIPPLQPYTGKGGGGLSESTLQKILLQTDFYIWNSYHLHPYHEGLRAIQAVYSGAIPAKIDPLHAKHFSDLPWVYSSVSALFDAQRTYGEAYLFNAARHHLSRVPTLGSSIHNLIRS